MDANERRSLLRQKLTEAAEQVIATEGLPALKARDLARAARCATGAIYNVFPDLDALILTVNLRTLVLFEAAIAGSSETPARAASAEEAVASLVRLALAYLAFAEDHRLRWQALFQHRIQSGEVPDWYRAEQGRLFRYIEAPLARLCPSLGEADLALRARSLFSCTHGLVSLGVDERLMPLPRATLAQEIELLVRATAEGLADSTANRRPPNDTAVYDS